ncbi:hypothetical protein AMS68_005377 [Peltaster fructicola]|uniref:Glucose-methanol-choline oxidoreductase N-terminal domain-containing protein n=1 Tax=Peltaster fructicola TaxID=286661 RepID=A0A6H0XZM3_9PEZI|nr:hypothetical protein AMS68_005377 [Peltaster fructicola]
MHSPLLTAVSLAVLAEASVLSQYSAHGRLTGSSFAISGTDATYDYVIVGGGLAGSVVATRLVQQTNATVAVVEAGSFYELSNSNRSQIPYWSYQGVGPDLTDVQPLVDWGLFTEPQVNGKRIHYAQGRNLGGSSGRNQMMYHRPTIGSYQAWADHVGDDSYTWDSMKKYLQRSMHFSRNEAKRPYNETPIVTPGTYSNGGPLQVSYPGWVWPISQYALRAFASIGMGLLNNFADGVLNGYGWWQWTINPHTGLRSSSESTFLEQAFQKETLTTYINSHVNNILFLNGTAVGVNVTNYGQRPFTLTARKEVIISAGAYHSPQLLMVSGIGPRATLEKYNISIVSDLPGVGQNMWDSCNVGGPIYEVSLPGYTAWQEPDMMHQAVQSLLTNGSGPLSGTAIDIGAWEKIPSREAFTADAIKALATFPADWPEVEYSFSTSSKTLESSSAKTQYASIGCVLVAALSRGNMTISSASNFDPPVISPNWLMNDTDQQVAVQAYKRARQAWQAVPVRVGEEVFPGTNVTTDAQLLSAIMGNITPIHHASASCAMGRAGDPQAVVDSRARVFGVQNLRVIDSSSLPFTPPGHTQGVTYAHAEKLVDDVLQDYWRECKQ